MNVKAVVHPVPQSEGGGYWAEVPTPPGCITEGDDWESLEANLREAVAGWLEFGDQEANAAEGDTVLETAV